MITAITFGLKQHSEVASAKKAQRSEKLMLRSGLFRALSQNPTSDFKRNIRPEEVVVLKNPSGILLKYYPNLKNSHERKHIVIDNDGKVTSIYTSRYNHADGWQNTATITPSPEVVKQIQTELLSSYDDIYTRPSGGKMSTQRTYAGTFKVISG